MPKKQTQATASETADTGQMPTSYDVRIFGAKDSGTQRATATVNINGVFAVRGVKILDSSNGVFVAMPQYKVGNEYKDICFPCTKESREQLHTAILEAYQQALTQKQTQSKAAEPQQAPAMSGQSM